MDFPEVVENYVKCCLLYPQLTLEQVFNRYMHNIPKESSMTIGEKAMIMLRAAEVARDAPKEVQDLIMEGMDGYRK